MPFTNYGAHWWYHLSYGSIAFSTKWDLVSYTKYMDERCALNCMNQFILFIHALQSFWQPLKHPLSIHTTYHIHLARFIHMNAIQRHSTSTQLNIFSGRGQSWPPEIWYLYCVLLLLLIFYYYFLSLPNFVDDTNILNHLPVSLVIHRFFHESIFKTWFRGSLHL